MERIGGFAVRRLPLPTGDAGTRMTLGFMRQLATEGSKDLEVRSAAIEALDRYGAQDHDPIGALLSVYRYVRDRIRFVPDPVGTQAIQSPRATLELGAGNCAQRATLISAMARSIGIPADLKFRVIAANPRRPRDFSHVYAVARIGGREIPMDPTYRTNPFGYEYPRATRMGDYPVMPYEQSSSPVLPSCCEVLTPTTLGFSLNPFKLIGKVIKPVLKIGAAIGTFAPSLIPGGQLVTAGLMAGSGLLSRRSGSASAPSASPWGFSARGRVLAQARAMVAARQAAQVPTMPASSTAIMAIPESMSSGGGGGGGGGAPLTTEASTDAASAPAAQGSGMGVAIVAGVVLLALMSRKRGR